MALVVGTDTYISLADAKTYMTANYMSTNARLAAWTALSDADKEIALRNACRTIENLPIAGAKAYSSQTLQFPRILYTSVGGNYRAEQGGATYPHVYEQLTVPVAVGYAQVEIAAQTAQGGSTRLALQRQGVTQYSIGNLSETFGKTALSAIGSEEAQILLSPWMATSAGVV